MSKVVAEGCKCTDYVPNIKLINDAIDFKAVSLNDGGYKGKTVRYCPWCGSKLRLKEVN